MKSTIIIGLFCLVFGVYLAVYRGQTISSDGDSMLATAISLARRGSADTAILGAQPPLLLEYSESNTYAPDGVLYSKKGLLPSLMMVPLVWLADSIPSWSARATVMLFNPLITTLTSALLYDLVTRLNFRQRTAVVTALAYAFATLALAYTGTLFREPLIALLLLWTTSSAYQYRANRSQWAALRVGVAVGLLVNANPVFLGYGVVAAFFLYHRRPGRAAIYFATPIVIGILMVAVYNGLRFGNIASTGFALSSGEGFRVPLWVGVSGLLVSPFRGIIWYSPLVLLAVPGLWRLYRQDRNLALYICAQTTVTILTFATWWSWYGGITWGPRYLLPTLPLLMLAIASVIDELPQRGVVRRLVFGGLFMLSVGINFLGVAYSPAEIYNRFFNAAYWTGDPNAYVSLLSNEVLWNPLISPIVGHAVLFISDLPHTLPALRDPIHTLFATLIILTGLWLLRVSSSRRNTVLGFVVLIGCTAIITSRQPVPSGIQALQQQLQPQAPVLMVSGRFGTSLMDYQTTEPVLAMRPPVDRNAHIARTTWSRFLALNTTAWFITWLSPDAPENWQERELWTTRGFGQQLDLNGHRALLFDFAPVVPSQESDLRFGEIALSAYGFQQTSESLRVTLNWQSHADLKENYTWFVHVLDEQGQIVAQQDRHPQGGFALTSSWKPGTTITDRLYFPHVQASAIRVGFLDDRGMPLSVSGGTQKADDFAILTLADTAMTSAH